MTSYPGLSDSLLSPDDEDFPVSVQRQFSNPHHISSQHSGVSAGSSFAENSEMMDTITLGPNQSEVNLADSVIDENVENAASALSETLYFDSNEQASINVADQSRASELMQSALDVSNMSSAAVEPGQESNSLSQYFMTDSFDTSGKIFKVGSSGQPLSDSTDVVEAFEEPPLVAAAEPVAVTRGDSLTEVPKEIHHSQTMAATFEESKGLGLAFVGSTRNLSKFFTDDAAGSDVDGRSFFDSFAAGDGVAEEEGQGHPSGAEESSPGTPLLTPFSLQAPFATVGQRSRCTSECTTNSDGASDPFSASLQTSDSDRRHDAWIPSPAVQQALISKALNPGSFFLEPEQMTMPCVMFAEPMGDPVLDLVSRFMGENEARKRSVLTADSVSQDENGLAQLVRAGCYRSAIDLTCRLLIQCGQGPNRSNKPAILTPFCLQVWFVRLAMYIKLKMYQQAETELIAFRSLDQADLYYEYYPDLYPGRKGCMVPFGMRVLHAELPHYLGKSQDALDRVCYIRAVIQRILANLNEGLSEDGSPIELSAQSQKVSIELWQKRERCVLHTIGNCLVAIKDYTSAVEIFDSMLRRDDANKIVLLSAIGRIFLQAGNLATASKYFELAAAEQSSSDTTATKATMNRGFQAMSQGSYEAAYNIFKDVFEKNPTYVAALNNMAVCALYAGRLREAIALLESLVHKDPARHLHDNLVTNLCTLYELESSRAQHRKQSLLALAAKHKGNGFNVASLKMT